MSMKMLITGGGFIGRAMKREYPKLDITIMSRTHRDGKWIKGEVTGFRFPDETFTHIIHAPLFMPPFCKYEPDGFLRVQEYARHCGAKLLYVSSGAATNPQDEYGEFKAKTEVHAAYDFIVRPYAFVGPDLQTDAHYAIMNFIRDAMRDNKILVKGDGTNIRSWQWQGDMARCFLTVLESGERGKPYDIGSFEEMSVKKVADLIAEMTDSVVTVEGNKYGNPKYVPRYENMCKAALPYVPLRESIRKTIECLKNQ